MTRKSIGLLSMAVACATAISISASSCDNNPTTPSNGKNSGIKGPQVLDGDCLSAIGARDCGVGEARVSYDENGNMQVSNMNESSGINSVFAQPINLWHASVEAEFPQSGNGSLTYAAQDVDGNTQAQVDIVQKDSRDYVILPTFTSPPEGGKPFYDVQILDDKGNVIASQEAVNIKEPVVVRPDCELKLQTVSWNVYQVSSQCIWRIIMNPCCKIQWILPDGTVVNGSQIKLTERNEKGFYVYLQTNNILTTGTTASYNVSTASARAF